jgi:hypothetical protein
MGGDDYVIDEARDKAWSSQSEAIAWYQAELARLEAKLSEAWDAGYCYRDMHGSSSEDYKATEQYVAAVLADRK